MGLEILYSLLMTIFHWPPKGTETATDNFPTEQPDYTADISNFIPEEGDDLAKRHRFPVYWNVPTFQCHKYGLNFSRVSEVWGIRQNYGDEFRGEELGILYDPGEFPALLMATRSGSVPRNGGVPQEGSMLQHLRNFRAHINKLIPDTNFSGLGILDFEHWRPVWRQNWGTLNHYREYSRQIEKKRHPFWFPQMIETEAHYRYEVSAKAFILDTLRLAKRMRPHAKWGYYGYPFCFNYTPNNNKASCSNEVLLDNDRMRWLFSETTALYPSLYLRYKGLDQSTRVRFMLGRLTEANRVSRNHVPVIPYIWYKYHDTHEFLSPEDMRNAINIPKLKGSKGVIIWGSSSDVNTETKCIALARYLEQVIGPAVSELSSTYDPGPTDFQEPTSSVIAPDNTIQRLV